MLPVLKRLSLLGAGAMLLACAGVAPHAPGSSLASAEENYLLGRGHQLELRPQQAFAYYLAALRAAPSHVDANNGLAALYAAQGQLALAIPIWERLAAAAHGADSAYLLVNLGHAYLLDGDAARAQGVLEQACLRDPLNPRAWEHLGAALGRLGQHERAQAMLRQAGTLRGHDIKSDYAVARGAGLAAIDGALKAAQDGEGQWARTEISQEAGGIFVLSRTEAGAPPARAAAPQHAASAGDGASQINVVSPGNFAGNVLFEISNGNGVTGMARALSGEVGQGSTHKVRLTNQKGFAVRHTRVEYKTRFKLQAAELAARYGAARMVQVGPSGRADVRLVLGRDLIKRPVLADSTKPHGKTS